MSTIHLACCLSLILTEPHKQVLKLVYFQSSELDQNVDLDATETMVSVKTGIECGTYLIWGNSKIHTIPKMIKQNNKQMQHSKNPYKTHATHIEKAGTNLNTNLKIIKHTKRVQKVNTV